MALGVPWFFFSFFLFFVPGKRVGEGAMEQCGQAAPPTVLARGAGTPEFPALLLPLAGKEPLRQRPPERAVASAPPCAFPPETWLRSPRLFRWFIQRLHHSRRNHPSRPRTFCPVKPKTVGKHAQGKKRLLQVKPVGD